MNINLDTSNLLITCLVGLAAGFLASLLIKNKGLGLLGMLIVGVLGAFIGQWLFSVLNITVHIINIWVDRIIVATVGATILLWLYNLLQGNKGSSSK